MASASAGAGLLLLLLFSFRFLKETIFPLETDSIYNETNK